MNLPFGGSTMWTTLSCVLFALIGAGIAAYLSRGRHPAPIIVGLIAGAIVGLAPLTITRQFLAGSANSPGLFDRIGLLIEALRNGDPVIWTATGACLLVVLVLLGLWAKTALEFRREKERKKQRGRGRPEAGRRQRAGRVIGTAPIAASEKCVVVEVARLRWLLWTSIGLAIAAVGLYRNIPGNSAWETIKAVLGVLLAAASLLTCAWWLLSKRQLLIGESRVMLVSFRRKRIVGHIPYHLIESVHFHHGEEGELLYKPGVMIRVRRGRGPETFWPWLLPGETDVIIQDRFVRSPAVLRKLLRQRWQDYRDRREAAGKPPPGFPEEFARR
jgi:hypothetical protein